MHNFEELARLLAAPGVCDPKPLHEAEEELQERKQPAGDRDGKQDPCDLEKFEDIEVGDPRDGP